MAFVFSPQLPAALPIAGSNAFFPVRRVYCVGRNYADHAREMGALAQAEGREPPFFFMKPGDAVVGGEGSVAGLSAHFESRRLEFDFRRNGAIDPEDLDRE